MLCYGPLVLELGAQSAWCLTTPSLGGLCPLPPSPGFAAYGLHKVCSLGHFLLNVPLHTGIPPLGLATVATHHAVDDVAVNANPPIDFNKFISLLGRIAGPA